MHRRKSVPHPFRARGEIGVFIGHSSRVCIFNLVATYEKLTSVINFIENYYTMVKTTSTSPTSTSTSTST